MSLQMGCSSVQACVLLSAIDISRAIRRADRKPQVSAQSYCIQAPDMGTSNGKSMSERWTSTR